MAPRQIILTGVNGFPGTGAGAEIQRRHARHHSADYGYTVKQSLALGYLPIRYAQEGSKVELLYRGQRHPATVAAVGTTPLFDPQNQRLKQ